MTISKTILIAGGAGFIGSNLCKRLLNENNYIICLDNLNTGKLENIKPFMTNPNFKFIHHDIINSITLLMLNYGIDKIDEIYNLACPASPPKYQSDPIFTLKTNFLGTMNLLDLAIQKKSKILLASTSEIYGEPEISPQPETYRGNVNTLGIRSCYDEGKRIAETLMMDYHRQYKVNTRIVRIFNTYGPNMDKNDGRVVTNLITQMLNNQDITVYGDGTQTRSFCYIDDLIEGIIRLMNSDYHLPVNIGNTNEITVNELSNILFQMIKTESRITFLPLPSDDPTNRRPDITLATNILGWEPKVELKNGLEKTIEYIQSDMN
jgi:UDP-glucuronate decarboxylase